MTISVIIPVFNGEKTIAKTIDSVLHQSFTDLEILVINDGSTDSTEQVVKSFQDSRIKILSYSNAGLSASRNRGIEQASGDFVSFIDADDLWTEDKLQAQYESLMQNKKAVVAYSWTNYIDANNKIIKAGMKVTFEGDVFARLLVSNFLENGSNPLIYRHVFNNVGGFDESLKAAEDWDMWLRLAAEYEFACVQKAQILYRVSHNSMSTKLKQQELASLKVVDKIYKHCRAENLKHIRKITLAHIYKYLTFKSLEKRNKIMPNFLSIYFLINCWKYDLSIRRQYRLMLITLYKILIPSFRA